MSPILEVRMWLPLLVLVLCGTALAQEEPHEDEPSRTRKTSVLLGLGNSVGWVGGQGERFFRGDRVSIFFGVGYTPALEEGYPGGGRAAFAAGTRVFTSGKTHRGFLELSVSQLAVAYRQRGEESEDMGLYGPGVQVGYHYVRRNGFTALLSAGVGFVVSEYSDLEGAQLMSGFGLGYTWAR